MGRRYRFPMAMSGQAKNGTRKRQTETTVWPRPFAPLLQEGIG